jgi:hypothetical protein
VGIGQVEELRDIADPEGGSLFTLDLQTLAGEAMEPLKRVAEAADATTTEIDRARKALEEAKAKAAPAAALFDIALASRIKGEQLPVDIGKWEKIKDTLPGSAPHGRAAKEVAGLNPLHFPVAFPEVFLRDRAGFDVILGNPPWEEATVEEDRFWNAFVPGLQAMPQRQQEEVKAAMRRTRSDLHREYQQRVRDAAILRRVLVTGPYPGMGTGDPDLYKAFCWRFWNLISPQAGRLGVVLPRSALTAKGSTDFRTVVLDHADPFQVTMLLNRAGWVFDDAEHRYSISLTGVCRRAPSGRSVHLRGPYASLQRFQVGVKRPPAEFAAREVLGWTDTASLPLLPTEESLEVFARMRQAPRLDLDETGEWRARPHTELHATNDKHLMDLKSSDCPNGYWPVYNGESFDLWEPDTGTYYAWAEPRAMLAHLQEKRKRGRTRRNSVWFAFEAERPPKWWTDPKTLPCHHARIAFKDLVRNTDSRTMKVGLIPPGVFMTNSAPFLLWPRGDIVDHAYLLGVLSSLPLDWYARRFVELHMNFFVFNTLPVPRPQPRNPLPLRLVELAARLACPDNRFEEWAKAVGAGAKERGLRPVEVGPLDAASRFDMLCEIDAVAAHLYGLEEGHLRHIFETFHEGWGPGTTAGHPTLGGYDDRLERTMEHYRRHAAER